MSETWHDTDSPVFSRLRSRRCTQTEAGECIVESRRHLSDRSFISQPSVGFTSGSGILLTRTCARLSIDDVWFDYAHRHLPSGIVGPSTAFVDNVSLLLERLIVLGRLVYIAGNFNIRFDRVDDPIAGQLHLLFYSYDLLLGRRTVLVNVRELLLFLNASLSYVICSLSVGCCHLRR